MSRPNRPPRLQHLRALRSNHPSTGTDHRILTTLNNMQHQATVPLHNEAFETIIKLIPSMLKDDEAGPAFYIIDDQWAEDNDYTEDTN